MKNIAFSKIWIIGILAAVLAGGIFAWQYWAPKPAPADETADWKNYKNEKLGFEFKYPKEYLFTDPAFGEGFRMYSNESGRIYSKDNILPTIDFAFYTTPDAMSVAVDKFPRTFKDLATDKNLKNIKEKTFRGDEAFEATFVNENINLELNQLYIYHNGHVYVWSIDTRHGDAGKKMFENILSTFRFLPPK